MRKTLCVHQLRASVVRGRVSDLRRFVQFVRTPRTLGGVEDIIVVLFEVGARDEIVEESTGIGGRRCTEGGRQAIARRAVATTSARFPRRQEVRH